MRSVLQVVTVLMAVVLSAGSGLSNQARKVAYTPATMNQYPAKPAGCPIVVLSTPPQQPYEELGTWDFDYRYVSADQVIRTATELQLALGPEACSRGADALLGFTTDAVYTRAVALRWKTPPAPPAAPPAPAEPAPAPAGDVPAQPY